MTQTFTATYPDDDATSSVSMLEQLRQELSVPLPEETLTLHLPERPAWEITYDVRIPWETMKAVSQRSTDSKTNKVDALKQQALTLQSQCVGITRNGSQFLEDGKPVTFKTQSFIDATGAVEPVSALRKFFGRDTDIMAHYVRLAEAAGFDREDQEQEAPDPTDS